MSSAVTSISMGNKLFLSEKVISDLTKRDRKNWGSYGSTV